MIFLGIDIGFDRCGFCILEINFKQKKPEILSAGTITTERKLPIAERLKILQEDLVFLKKKYTPEFVCIEKLFFYRKNTTFEKICMAKGVALLTFSNAEILEIEPKAVKKFITGNGSADKQEIRRSLETIMNLDLKGILDDTLDAYILALYQIEDQRIEQLAGRRTKK